MTPVTISDKDIYSDWVFDESKVLARLLAEEVIFINSFWWEKDWPKRARKQTALCVVCNDIFVWGSADAECVDFDEIQELYNMWIAYPIWGGAKWCALKRNCKPQQSIIDCMKKDGVWDEDMGLLTNEPHDPWKLDDKA